MNIHFDIVRIRKHYSLAFICKLALLDENNYNNN